MKNTPPHVKLTLPDGSRLTAVAYSQEDYPGINLYLSRTGHPEELICFVEFNRERQAGENICIDGGMTRQMIYHGDFGWNLTPDPEG